MDLTIVIVSFKSEDILHRCIKSIDKKYPIIVVENSIDNKLKLDLEHKYQNVNCILPKENLGYGGGNNLALSKVTTNFALILNPDVILEENSIENFFITASKVPNFGIIAPISANERYDNFNHEKDLNIKEVENVKGFAMFLNMKNLEKSNFFDDNFFLYLEEIDLCKRVRLMDVKIFIDPSIKVEHFGGTSHNSEINKPMELSRNWHWMWSSFYFNKKHYGYLFALIKIFPKFFSSLFKFILYLIIFKKNKSDIYKYRLLGIINSVLLKKSWYRPFLN
jgi:N-acetylglucosaminyl-diphospho-decaprenol L-rhamnosyltransferase